MNLNAFLIIQKTVFLNKAKELDIKKFVTYNYFRT